MANTRRSPNPLRIQALVDLVERLLGRKHPQSPADPYAYVMAPLRRGPKGRSGAAVADIENDSYRAFPPRRL
jgi:hypothetical protein